MNYLPLDVLSPWETIKRIPVGAINQDIWSRVKNNTCNMVNQNVHTPVSVEIRVAVFKLCSCINE
jgi:hypothetical protein